MFKPKPLLRQLDDDTLIEVLSAEDTSQPRQWQRGFTYIGLVVGRPQLGLSHRLQQTFGLRGHSQDAPLVTSDLSRSLVLSGQVEGTERYDDFWRTRKAADQDDSVFETVHCPRHIEINVRSVAEPMEGNDIYGAGTFPGAILASDPDLDLELVTLDLTCPEPVLAEIAASLHSGAANAVALDLAIQVFTHEVDNALREHHHRQTYVIHSGVGRAVLLSIRTLKLTPDVEPPPPASLDSTPQIDPALYVPPDPLRGIAVPLWVIAGLLLLQLILR